MGNVGKLSPDSWANDLAVVTQRLPNVAKFGSSIGLIKHAHVVMRGGKPKQSGIQPGKINSHLNGKRSFTMLKMAKSTLPM